MKQNQNVSSELKPFISCPDWTFSQTNVARCTSTGRKCDGYPPISEAFQVQVWSSSQASNPQSALSALTGFGDSVRYLEFYHHCARPTLSSHFDQDFWSRIALQMAYSEPAVRHALVAIGYLCKTEPGDMKHARSKYIADIERRVVLTHYNKSVRCLVERINEATYSPEVALVTCLLFVCIEFIQGNYHTGFTHMGNGFKIITDRKQKSRQSSPSSSTSSSPQLASSNCPTDLIEDKLVPIFTRGIASALLYGFQVRDYFDVPSPNRAKFSQQPFATLFEAQQTCHELRNACVAHLGSIGRSWLGKGKPTIESYQEQDSLLACHHIWYQRLKDFEEQSRLSAEEQVTVSALKVSHHTTFVTVSCSTVLEETAYDAHLERFKEIIRHGKLVVESLEARSQPHAANFTFDISLIPPLYFAATNCRCPTTRREAVALLARNPPREGLWDSKQFVLVANRVIEMEESELNPETGWPVEDVRLWNATINAEMDRNGGFWASFLPTRWVGESDATGKQKVLWEFFVLKD
jgi:hypothetical protein